MNRKQVIEFVKKYEQHSKVAKGVLDMTAKWDADTLKFVRTMMPQIARQSIEDLLANKELKKHTVEFPNGLKLIVNLELLRATPILEKTVDMEALAKLNSNGGEAIAKQKESTSIVDSLYKLSLLFSVLATECLLFTPISSDKSGLFDLTIQSASSLNLEMLSVLTEDVSDRLHSNPNKNVDLTKAVTMQGVVKTPIDGNIETDIHGLLSDFAPKSGLGQRIPLTDNSTREDVKLFKIDFNKSKIILEGLYYLLQLTKVMLGNDYAENQMQVFSEIMDSLSDDKNECLFYVKPAEVTLPLKLGVGVKYVNLSKSFDDLAKDIPAKYHKIVDDKLMVQIYDTMYKCECKENEDCSYCGGENKSVPYEVAVAYMEGVQGYETGYIKKMVAYAKQMFRAKQAVQSIDTGICCVTPKSQAITIEATDTNGNNEDVFHFAIKMISDDKHNLDTTAMKSKDSLLLVNPYFTKVSKY